MNASEESKEMEKYLDHNRKAALELSQEYDALVAKLGTVGLTLAIAVVGFTSAPWWGFLLVSGILFALALTFSLLSIRLSADGLRRLNSGDTYNEIWQFPWVRITNWASFFCLGGGFIFLALHLFVAAIDK